LQSLISIIFDAGILGYVLDSSDGETKELNETIKLVDDFLHILNMPVSLSGGISNFGEVQEAMMNDVFSEPVDPVTGIYLKPYDMISGKPFNTYLEWIAAYNSEGFPKGSNTNFSDGENTRLGIALIESTFDRYWPLVTYTDSIGMFELEITTSNEPIELIGPVMNIDNLPLAVRETVRGLLNLLREKSDQQTKEYRKAENKLNTLLTRSYKKISSAIDYSIYYKNIDIPLISFESKFGLLLWGPFIPGIKSKDVTNGGEYPFLGHLDIFIGKNNYKLVNKPVFDWLEERIK
jgi:hypothetical protein